MDRIPRSAGSSRNAVTVVFDGRSDVWGGGAVPSPVQIIFSREESADEKIIRMVEEAAHKKSVVVVTDDRALRVRYAPWERRSAVSRRFWGREHPPRSVGLNRGKIFRKLWNTRSLLNSPGIWVGEEKG